MKRRRCIMATIALLLFFVPVLTQAHLMIYEGECFRKVGKPSDWDRFSGIYLPPDFLGGEDWSFEHPFILPDGQRQFGWAIKSHLHRNDIDVIKYELQEGEELCFFVYAVVPGCHKYRNYYPVVGILGPDVPKIDEFPFDYPDDCKECGFVRTYPTKAKRDERYVICGPPGLYPESCWWWMLNFETDALDGLTFQGPGNYYLVTYHPEGKPGDVGLMAGTWECEPPEQVLIQHWMRYIGDSQKWARGICNVREEPLPIPEIPAEAKIPRPVQCGDPACPEELR